MSLQIITVTLEDGRIDCKVQGSTLSVSQYGDAVALVIRSIAGLFASSGQVTESQVVEEIIRVVDDKGRMPVETEKQHLH
jgi:hypothetical protein